jgi:hypothetical protein
MVPNCAWSLRMVPNFGTMRDARPYSLYRAYAVHTAGPANKE